MAFSLTQINKKYLDIYNFFCEFNIYRRDEDSSYYLDLISVLQALTILYNGIGNNSKRDLDKELNFEIIPTPMHARAGVFAHENCPMDEHFRDDLRRQDIYFSNLPKNETQIEKINKKFKKWPIKKDPFITKPFLVDHSLYIRTQTLFNGYWQKPFNKCDTKMDYFYISENKKILVPMMKNSGVEKLLTYHHDNNNNNHKLRNCLFVSIPFEKNLYKMLIIMSDKASNQRDLLHICTNELESEDITNFYANLGAMTYYKDKIIPKFEFETEWNISLNDDNIKNNCPYINRLLSKTDNLENISHRGVELQSSTKIINGEKETRTKAKTEIYKCDSTQKMPTLKINKGFIFMILNERNIICSMGIYTGLT